MKRERGKRRKRVTISRTTEAVLAGDVDLSEWDDDEIFRGNRRGKDGYFHGRPPKMVPQAIHEERHRRFFQGGMELLNRNAIKAVQYLIRVVEDESVSHSDRIRAAQFVVEKAFGRAPEHVRLDVGIGLPKWMQALTEGIVATEEQLIEGKVIDVEPKPEPEPKPQERAPRRARTTVRTRRDGPSIVDRRLGRA